MSQFRQDIESYIRENKNGDIKGLYKAVAGAAMKLAEAPWGKDSAKKRACYLSAEFLIGRVIYSNLLNLGVLEDFQDAFRQNGLDPNMFEEIEDAALGNGGLGRLAACFLDSAATMELPLDGYGIRYRYGLFKQHIDGGFQNEAADEWLRLGDPWSVRKDHEKVRVDFKDQSVWAVPYDMPVIGYGGKTVNTLRLWQAEPMEYFDFDLFNNHKYLEAFKARSDAESISAVLYPNDDNEEGLRLRIKQEYFFSSASIQSIVRDYKAKHGEDFSKFSGCFAIQLNDTHPVVAIPELLRILLSEERLVMDEAFPIIQKTFAYTNHTIMAEALEKWNVDLFNSVIPEVYPYVVMLQNHLKQALHNKGINGADQIPYYLVDNKTIHMARIAIFASHSTNGVAEIHSNILKEHELNEWYRVWPERFSNKTNGITQRRWLKLCNPGLADFITERIGDGWVTDLNELKRLEPYADETASLRRFMEIKKENKKKLAGYVKNAEYGFELNVDSIFDVQIKRLHEYKRQLLNAFSILDIYYGLKEGRIKDFYPMTFLFGAKAAPGYYRAKGIIKYINEIAGMVNKDPETRNLLQVLFAQNYNVSYAERMIPATDVSEQISTAGTEASGTGNMKFMLNGAVTLGTYDGANIEIVEQAGEENNFIFGARVEDIRKIAGSYDTKAIYKSNPRIRRVVDSLIDGTFSDKKTGMFQELYDSLLESASWHKPDNYYLMLDFEPYVEAKLAVNKAYRDEASFAKMCLLNTAGAGHFSSDRTVEQYAREIWGIL